MIKKLILGGVGAVVLGTLVFGGDVFSYAKTWGSSIRESVKSEVPIEFEVRRARDMVEELLPQIRQCMHVIAEEQVDVEYLETDLAKKTDALAGQKQEILALRGHLESGKDIFTFASRTYTSDEVKRDLSARFRRYKTAEESAQRDAQILDARRKALTASEERLENMLAAKSDLEVEIERLETRLKTVQAAQATTTLEIDDSQLARAKRLIGELNKQLDVREKMLDADGKFTGLIPVDLDGAVKAEDLADEIDSYFGGNDEVEVEIETKPEA